MNTRFSGLRVSTLAIVLGVSTAGAVAQIPDALKHSLFDPDTARQAGAQQGASVASDGDFVVAGAPYDNIDGAWIGLVRVYHAATGALLQTIRNPRPTQSDYFGKAVAISGSRVVVGAPASDVGGEDRGRAYIYDLASATPTLPVVTLNNPDNHIQSDNHNFGDAVAIAATTVVIGAKYAHVAYVYDLTSAAPEVPRLEIPDPTPAVYDAFGASVAVSGSTVAVGTSIPYPVLDGTSPEAVFVFDLAGAQPSVPRLVLRDPRPTPNNGFGEALALAGSHLIVGAPKNSSQAAQAGSAYLFDLGSPTPTQPVQTFDQPGAVAQACFGTAVALVGGRIVIGAPRTGEGAASDAGNAYIYELDGATPTVPAASLPHPNPSPGARFGAAVALTGGRAIIGSPGDDTVASDGGAAFVYTLPIVAPPVPAATLNVASLEAFHFFGHGVGVSGGLLVVGASAPSVHIVYVYDLAGTTPATPRAILRNPRPGIPDGFGVSVAISGMRVIVGAPGDDLNDNDPGRAYIYDLASATPAVPVMTLHNPSPAEHDDFGHSVAISGARAVIGAPYDDTSGPEAGSAYVYDLTSATPETPVLTLNNPGPEVVSTFGEAFGINVAIDGTRVAIGARFDNYTSNRVGTVFVYDLTGATPAVPLQVLRNPSSSGFDDFASSLAISGTRVLAGAFQYGEQIGRVMYRRGRAYLFELASETPTVPALTIESPFAGSGAIDDPPGTATTGVFESWFGRSVAISGTRLVIGTSVDVNGVDGAGTAFLYDRMSPSPGTPVATLSSPRRNRYENFGNAVAIDGGTVAIGAPGNSTNGYDRGAVFVFGAGPFSFFRINELGDPFAPALGDADHDGLSNLLEYALVLPPRAASVGPAPDAFSYAEGNRLRLLLARDPSRDDVTIEVQATSDLTGPWATIATSAFGAPFSGPGYVSGDNTAPGLKTVEIRDVVNLESTAQRFLRVRVTR